MSKAKRPSRKRAMSPVHAHAAAIDIGATLNVAAVGPDRDPEPVRSFGTFTADLHRMADWFERCGVRTVAMESTGVYWIPVYEMLEQRGFVVVLVNARDAKHVPGRKTDVSDAEWLQRLHEYGLPPPVRARGQGQAGHRHRAQDRRAVLQHPATRHGLHRSRSLLLRGAIQATRAGQSPTQGEVARLRAAGHRPDPGRGGSFLGTSRSQASWA